MEVRSRRGSSSPDRVKVNTQPKVVKLIKPIRKVQIVYYLTRNGQLEHPHYMELTHLVNQPLRLRDVIQRLTALRGKGMPSLYSWSCKRSYKNGYVWNDLAENDIIPPSDGPEYVLKGSELVEGCSERLQQLQTSNKNSERTAWEEQELEEEEEFEVDEEKTSYATTPHCRCPRGVSTDELEVQQPQKSVSQNLTQTKNTTSTRFEDGDPIATESAPSRNSVLLQIIACGNLAVTKAKNAPLIRHTAVPSNVVKKGENLHRGVLCKSAVKVAVAEDDQIISCMSENPRYFGKLQGEDKDYFSGSIVESMSSESRVEADQQQVLQRSNSYNEERSCKAGLDDTAAEEKKTDKTAKAKCIPRKKSTANQTRK